MKEKRKKRRKTGEREKKYWAREREKKYWDREREREILGQPTSYNLVSQQLFALVNED